MNTFLVLRYVVFALFILFSSIICIVAALNFGSLAPNTPRSPEIDSYLIFLGALGIVIVFPVLFIERIRKNAFISRVTIELTWVALLWIMHLSGAAAITAIAPQIRCSATGLQVPIDCASTKALLALTWLSTITLLSYLLGLLICSIQHHSADGRVWRSGVCDFPWFRQYGSKSQETPVNASFSYGKLVDPNEPQPPVTMYAQQIGLTGSYSVEPLTLEAAVERPMLPVPVPAASIGSRLPRDIETHRPPPPPPVVSMSTSNSLSLYPQHLQATAGITPLSTQVSGRSPPPAGSWPRSNPQEPLPRKQRSVPKAASAPSLASSSPPTQPQPQMAQRNTQVSTSSAARSKPLGPRTASQQQQQQQRVRPPPLDLSRVTSYKETRQ